MTSPVSVKRARPNTTKPLSRDDRKRAAALCPDVRLLDELARARLSLALTPAAIPQRDLAKTLDELAGKLRAAGDALHTMPHPAAALLQVQTRASQAMPDDVGMALLDLAAKAQLAARLVVKESGRPPDPRTLTAVDRAAELRAAFGLRASTIPELASLILGAEVSADTCKRARRHIGRKLP